MATAFGTSEPSRKETETLINDYFNRIIVEVNERRIQVLSNFRDIQENTARINRSIKQLEDMKVKVEAGMTENTLYDKKEGMTRDLDKEIRDLKLERLTFEDVGYQFVFDDTELKRALSNLGTFEKSPKHYLSKSYMKFGFGIPIESGKFGKFSVDEDSQIIAINNRNEKEIMYLDLCGMSLLNCFSLESYPTVCEIEIINYQEILVSILDSKSILRIQFNPREQIEAKFVSESQKFQGIISLSYDKQSDRIYALSSIQNCIYIFERNLTLLIAVKISCTLPQSLFVGEEMVYILKPDTSCLHILSKSTKTGKVIQCGRNNPNTNKPTSFFVDRNENIILTMTNLIQIYSPSGHLLHSLTLDRDPDTVIQPISVYVTRNYDIIVLSDDTHYPIQIF